jgi:hypothetical protein
VCPAVHVDEMLAQMEWALGGMVGATGRVLWEVVGGLHRDLGRAVWGRLCLPRELRGFYPDALMVSFL